MQDYGALALLEKKDDLLSVEIIKSLRNRRPSSLEAWILCQVQGINKDRAKFETLRSWIDDDLKWRAIVCFADNKVELTYDGLENHFKELDAVVRNDHSKIEYLKMSIFQS